MPNRLLEMLILAPPLLFSLTIHEYSHARMALAFGDPTAKLMGRLTLNPLKHLDLIGTIAIFLVKFGWAKPVPVNPLNLHPRRLGDVMVSLAGPASNLLLAVVCGVALRLVFAFADEPSALMVHVLLITMLINVALCVFNMIPLFPLDGHHILREMLPANSQQGFMEWQVRAGRMVLLGLIFVPRLIEHVTGQAVFNPLRWLFGVASNWAIALLLA